MKRTILLSLFLILVIGISCGFTAGQKVYDQAGLLTDAQISSLEVECLRIAEEKQVDVILLTVDDAGGKTAMEVADDFYDNNDFGYEMPHGTGILFLIDMDNREAWISTSAEAIYYFSDQRIQWVLDDVFVYLPGGDYNSSFQAFLRNVEIYMGLPIQAREGPYGIVPPVWWSNNFVQAGFGIVIALIAVLILIARSRTQMTAGNKEYMTGVRMTVATDEFVRRMVTSRKIPRNTGVSGGGGGGSSTHTSGGGFSHGGGGRGF